MIGAFFCFPPGNVAIMGGRGRGNKGSPDDPRQKPEGLAFNQFLDAALQLALFLFAFAQAFGEVRTRQFVRLFRVERHADEIVAPPDDPSHHRAPLARDRQPQRILGQAYSVVEFEMGAMLGDVAHHAIPGRSTVGDLSDPAIDNLVARALASVLHRKLPIESWTFTQAGDARKGTAAKKPR